MSEGAKYPKAITLADGLTVVVESAAEEQAWLHAPLPPTPDPVKESLPPIPAEDPHGTIGSFVKKLKTKAGSRA